MPPPEKRKFEGASTAESVSLTTTSPSPSSFKAVKVSTPVKSRPSSEIKASENEDKNRDEMLSLDGTGTLAAAETFDWGSQIEDLMDFSSNELPKEVATNLATLSKRITDLQKFVQNWIKITPAERAAHFSDALEEERMSLWIMNALVSLAEVYCRLQGLDTDKEGINLRKDLLNRYAYKFDELEPHSHLFSRVESGPTTSLDIPAVRRFIKPALPAGVNALLDQASSNEEAEGPKANGDDH